MSKTDNDLPPLPGDLLWTVAAIAEYIGRTTRQTYHLLERRLVPATKVGNQWTARRSELNAFFRTQPAPDSTIPETPPTAEDPE